MTDAQILYQSIREAGKKGFSWLDFFGDPQNPYLREGVKPVLHIRGTLIEVCQQMIDDNTWPVLVFNEAFARALWGNKKVHHYDLVDLDNGGKTTTVKKPISDYHLQQLVVADNKFKYLEENM